jgi:hypothetical protein
LPEKYHIIESIITYTKTGSKGLIIPVEAVPKFKKLLVHFYETDEKKDIVTFLKEKCLTRL